MSVRSLRRSNRNWSWNWHALVVLGTSATAGCMPGDDLPTDPGAISVSITPSFGEFAPGWSQQVVATVTRLGAFTGEVTLRVTGQPAGINAYVSHEESSGTVTTISVIIDVGQVPAGSYPLVIHCTGDGVDEATAAFMITIPQIIGAIDMGFLISLSTATLSIRQGDSTPTATVNVVRNTHFGSVYLEVAGLPAGVRAVFDPAVIYPDNTSRLTLVVGATVLPGRHSLTVVATDPEGEGELRAPLFLTVTPRPEPALTFAGIAFTLIDLGGNHLCGLEGNSGLAYCWGDNHAGALGAGEVDGSDAPVLVGGGARRFSALSAGSYATCGLEVQTGNAWCWGSNFEGDLGDGTRVTRWLPTLVANGSIRFSDINAAGGLTCGVEAGTGYGYCWGKGGLIGDGTSSQRSLPTRVGNGLLRFASISTSEFHACGIEAVTGFAYCWGQNTYGQIGDGTLAERLAPTLVDGGSHRFTTIDTGWGLSCGVEAVTGLAYCWGLNDVGQVGDGTTTNRLAPTQVDAGSHRFLSVDASVFTCGVEAETRIGYCWGRGNRLPTSVGDGSLRFNSITTVYGVACGAEVQTGRGYCWNYLQRDPYLLAP